MKRYILIRFDDLCPTMDFTQWGRAMDLLEKYSIRPLVGVIPECMDPVLQISPYQEDFWDNIRLLQSKGFKVAMHGCNHVLTNRTEFKDIPLSEQCAKIKHGKEELEKHGIETDIFFAPCHSYDDNTLLALSTNGFKYLSDGFTKKPIRKNGIICVPCRSSGIPKIIGFGGFTAVLHAHEWNWSEKAADYDAFVRFLEKYHNDIVSFEDYIACSKVGNRFVQEISAKTFLIYRNHIRPFLVKVKYLWK